MYTQHYQLDPGPRRVPRSLINFDAQIEARLLEFKVAWSHSSRLTRSVATSGLSLTWLNAPPIAQLVLLGPSFSSEPFISSEKIVTPRGDCSNSSAKYASPPRFLHTKIGRRIPDDYKSFKTKSPTFKLPNHNTLRKILPRNSFLAKMDLQHA